MTKERLIFAWMIILTVAVAYLLTVSPNITITINGKAFLNGEEIKNVSVSTKTPNPYK